MESQYINLIKHILENGISKDDRTGIGTLSIFSYNMTFGIIVQARMGSTRLPGKMMEAIGDQPMIQVVLSRLSKSNFPEKSSPSFGLDQTTILSPLSSICILHLRLTAITTEGIPK